MIQLDRVTHSFGSEVILKEINWKIETDKTVILTGPSGHGKTTLLKLIAQIVSPTTGSVEHKDVSKIGFLFQNNALFDSLSTYENLAFPLRELRSTPENELDDQVMHFLKLVGLEDAKNRLPSELSGGMQKRLGIARALIIKPDFMIYDEPTAGLDPITSRSITELISIQTKNIEGGMLIVSSDLNRINQFDRDSRGNATIYFLANAKLVSVGSFSEMQESSDPLINQFVTGSPHGPMDNLI